MVHDPHSPPPTPNVVTHYHLPQRRPFLNLSDVAPDNRPAVMNELNGIARAGLSHRKFGPKYLQLRLETEALLRRRFLDRGGVPDRTSPHYFVLGESEWFQALYPQCAQVQISLSELPHGATSLTWSDSLASMGLGAGYGLPTFPKPQYGQVFLLDELDDLISTYGLPATDAPDSYAGYQRQEFDHFVEVQLWTDEPVREWITGHQTMGNPP